VHRLVFPTTTTPPTRSYTIEAGDPEVEAEVMPYAVCTKLSLSGAGGEAIKVAAEFMGRYVDRANGSTGAFSTVGSFTVVETILAAGSVWMTPAGSNFGTGLAPGGNILGFSIDFERPWEPKFATDTGTTYFHTAVPDSFQISGEITYEHQATGTFSAAGSQGQITKWRNQDGQLMRMEFPGGTVSGGTAGALNKLLRIDLPIKWSSFDPLGDQNGNSIRVGKFFSKYDETSPLAGRGSVTIITRGTSVFDGAA
jgi:hypothetical protein